MLNKEELLISFLKQQGDGQKLKNFLTISTELKKRAAYCNGYPVWLAIDPTNICNLKCPFCATGFGNIKRPKGMMSIKNFEKIMDILGPYLLYIDMQNWGEPLLNKDIYKMVSYAKKFNIYITLSTNFQNFDERSAEEMIGSRLDRLILSIDGASQEAYGKYRRGGDFLKAIENIKTLVRKKKELKSYLPVVIWQFLVFRHNEHEIEIAKRMGKELGIDDVGINSAFIAVDSEEYKDWVPLNSRYSRYDLGHRSKNMVGSDNFLKPGTETVCNWPWLGITINWDCSISPCCGVFLEEDDFGNILDQPNFKQVWNNIHYRIAREFMQKKNKPSQEIRNTCVNCIKIGQINIDLNPDFWIKDNVF